MTSANRKAAQIEKPSVLMALIPLISTIVLVAIQVFYFKDGSPHIPLAIGVLITTTLGWFRGYRWADMQEGMFNVIHVALPAIFILYTIGLIIASWIMAGTVPLMIYYGLQVLSPSMFLFAACIVCSIVSIATGTSWGTVGTMGLALMGIGEGLGVPLAMTAGAIVSGAFFGDKMSPLSDTTNFSPAVVGTDLFTHIRNMLPVTAPAMLIALGVYLWAGHNISGEIDTAALAATTTTLKANFNLSAFMLLPAIIVMYLSIRKYPALPGLMAGVVAGVICAILVQGVGVHQAFDALLNGYKADTGVASVDTLLSKGGIMSMNWTVTLVLIALALGGALEATRCLETLLNAIIKFATTRFRLLMSSLASVLGIHLATGDVFLAMALPGRMFAPAFRGKGIHVTGLSRTMEDGATLAAPLIPWSTGGVFVASTLGVATLDYWVWAIACWVSIVIDIVYAATGMFIPAATENDVAQWQERDEPVLVDGVLLPGSQISDTMLKL
ncbi:Na+/H+ antiporter NhaC [Paracoccus sp. R12_1]|uniref:Na+/H+ antiporter NhaC n=1 Tax=unclassified Paracoccus (in: a-proteobacteria) TaxID=2688777 RepID=UPI001ADAC4FF|nr:MULTISPECIES: Na+/H+ antiporter NhaC [unclassified Paracoccus (in: a-proteobacteria)]MBO9457003.1 Na+/H+ antiporter NhaC [Paracoccus sp. R12_2]MBO9488112.1 Na+/H+ antiporter NhaC [Paracoccus sp. R12_1]